MSEPGRCTCAACMEASRAARAEAAAYRGTLERLVGALPRCQGCGTRDRKPARRSGSPDHLWCDAHAPNWSSYLLYAPALREAQALLAGKPPTTREAEDAEWTVREHLIWSVYGWQWPERGIWTGEAPTREEAVKRASRPLGIHAANLTAVRGILDAHPGEPGELARARSQMAEARKVLDAGEGESVSEAAQRVVRRNNLLEGSLRELEAALAEADRLRGLALDLESTELAYLLSPVAQPGEKAPAVIERLIARARQADDLEGGTERVCALLEPHRATEDRVPYDTMVRIVGRVGRMEREIADADETLQSLEQVRSERNRAIRILGAVREAVGEPAIEARAPESPAGGEAVQG